MTELDIEIYQADRGAGKTHWLQGRIRADLAAGRRAVLIVPVAHDLDLPAWRWVRNYRAITRAVARPDSLERLRGLDLADRTAYIDDADRTEDGLGPIVEALATCRCRRIVATASPNPEPTLRMLARLDRRTAEEARRAAGKARRDAWEAERRAVYAFMVAYVRLGALLAERGARPAITDVDPA